MKDIIVIVGPTGIGKTKCSIELAKRLDAEIINGDSVSIYKKLNIGSAKPTIEERENIPHHLLDIKEPCEEYTVYDYQKDVRRTIEEIISKNKRVIIVGGTGFYIKAALYEYDFDEEKSKKDYSHLTEEEIIERIKEYNIKKIPIGNRRRLERLLNKCEDGQTITYHKDHLLYPVTVIGLTVDREVLYKRINTRVDEMFQKGLVEEVENLKNEYQTSRVLNSAIGYKEFYDYLYGNKSLDEVKEEMKQNSRRFAKRQYTFFKNQFPTNWVEVNINHFDKTIEEVEKIIK